MHKSGPTGCSSFQVEDSEVYRIASPETSAQTSSGGVCMVSPLTAGEVPWPYDPHAQDGRPHYINPDEVWAP